MNRPTRLLALLAVILLARPVEAELRLPSVFTEGMVLQRERPVQVWGRADAGSQVRVVLESAGAKGTRTLTGRGLADDTGRWMVRLEADPRETPGHRRHLDAGDLRAPPDGRRRRRGNRCVVPGGGSNHDRRRAGGRGLDLRRAVEHGMVDRRLRRRRTEPGPDGQSPTPADRRTPPGGHLPREDVEARWESCTPENLGDWTAVGYFFGERLIRELDVPVGLISSNWGGTRIEPWIDREDLAAHPRFAERSAALQDRIERWNRLDREELRRLRSEAERARPTRGGSTGRRSTPGIPAIARGGWHHPPTTPAGR